jgi:hypothetical protein
MLKQYSAIAVRDVTIQEAIIILVAYFREEAEESHAKF